MSSTNLERMGAYLSHDVNPLKRGDLSANFLATMTLNDRVRERLRTEKDRLKLTERDIAGMINWGQSKVAQKLGGRTPITMNELESLCFAMSLAPTEAVRDPGLEFVTEMTPTELRMFERIRKMTADQRAALLVVLNVAPVLEPRRALPKKAVQGPRKRA